jgi:hypothetical protein
MRLVQLRVLIPVNLLLIFVAFIGFIQAAGKDDTTTTEALFFWLSLAAMPFLLLALLILICIGLWRAARQSVSKRKAAGLAS